MAKPVKPLRSLSRKVVYDTTNRLLLNSYYNRRWPMGYTHCRTALGRPIYSPIDSSGTLNVGWSMGYTQCRTALGRPMCS